MPKKKKRIVVANWKMNPGTLREAETIFMGIKKETRGAEAKIIVCPPFVYLNELKHFFVKDRLALGVQDIFWEEKGAYTGEISAEMIETVGGSYVIVGHSERRALGETDEMISKKTLAALKAGLTVILCIGEKERDDHGKYLGFLKEQMSASLKSVNRKFADKIIVAYEPIWAIGKGHAAMTPHDLHQMSLFIRKHLIDIYNSAVGSSIPILYGGSVDPDNAASIVNEGEVDGLLVGRESLNPERFGMIARSL